MIPILELIRLEESGQGTIGVLRINKQVFCMTLELRDEENTRNRSSIPAQQYMCKRILVEDKGEFFHVLDVPGRSGILFHVGNTSTDSEGCILLGFSVGILDDRRAILNSSAAFYEFMSTMEGHDYIHLTIIENY